MTLSHRPGNHNFTFIWSWWLIQDVFPRTEQMGSWPVFCEACCGPVGWSSSWASLSRCKLDPFRSCCVPPWVVGVWCLFLVSESSAHVGRQRQVCELVQCLMFVTFNIGSEWILLDGKGYYVYYFIVLWVLGLQGRVEDKKNLIYFENSLSYRKWECP